MKQKNKNLGCLSTLILVAFFFFAVSAASLILGSIIDPSGLSEDNDMVFGIQMSTFALIVLIIIYLAMGGKLSEVYRRIKGKDKSDTY